MIKFEAGKTYWTRSICDHDCIFKIAVASRTAKTIVLADGKRLRVAEWQGVETVKPYGSYSMAAVIGADRDWADELERMGRECAAEYQAKFPKVEMPAIPLRRPALYLVQ